MPSLYDLLACPTCKVAVERADDALTCPACARRYPVIDGVPVMMPDGGVPTIEHEQDLGTYGTYFPWIHRLVMQSLLDDQVVVEIGSGNLAIDDPCLIRMDVRLTPQVDLVADAHALPFLPGTVDFIFSLAVVEHLRDPFGAAREIYDALKDGGYAYHECNFVFAYHGYPHHYFNASVQGMEQVFGDYRPLRQGIAPYQMPSQALLMVLSTYLRDCQAGDVPGGPEFLHRVQGVLDQELIDFDRGFTEETAANVAAGTYFFGVKQTGPDSTCLPAPVWEAWAGSRDLQERFPEPLNLGTVDNLLLWARAEGADAFPAIERYLRDLDPFTKHGPEAPWDRSVLRSFPLVEPRFGTIFDYPDHAPPRKPANDPPHEPADDPPPSSSTARRLYRYWRDAGSVQAAQLVAKKARERIGAGRSPGATGDH
jgi:uncharacterized protein YbaR (Trm112 family)/SAM-dependent methyltransferase